MERACKVKTKVSQLGEVAWDSGDEHLSACPRLWAPLLALKKYKKGIPGICWTVSSGHSRGGLIQPLLTGGKFWFMSPSVPSSLGPRPWASVSSCILTQRSTCSLDTRHTLTQPRGLTLTFTLMTSTETSPPKLLNSECSKFGLPRSQLWPSCCSAGSR